MSRYGECRTLEAGDGQRPQQTVCTGWSAEIHLCNSMRRYYHISSPPTVRLLEKSFDVQGHGRSVRAWQGCLASGAGGVVTRSSSPAWPHRDSRPLGRASRGASRCSPAYSLAMGFNNVEQIACKYPADSRHPSARRVISRARCFWLVWLLCAAQRRSSTPKMRAPRCLPTAPDTCVALRCAAMCATPSSHAECITGPQLHTLGKNWSDSQPRLLASPPGLPPVSCSPRLHNP